MAGEDGHTIGQIAEQQRLTDARVEAIREEQRGMMASHARLEERVEQHWLSIQRNLDSLHRAVIKTNEKLDAEIKAVYERMHEDERVTSTFRQDASFKDGRMATIGVLALGLLSTLGGLFAVSVKALWDYLTGAGP